MAKEARTREQIESALQRENEKFSARVEKDLKNLLNYLGTLKRYFSDSLPDLRESLNVLGTFIESMDEEEEERGIPPAERTAFTFKKDIDTANKQLENLQQLESKLMPKITIAETLYNAAVEAQKTFTSRAAKIQEATEETMKGYEKAMVNAQLLQTGVKQLAAFAQKVGGALGSNLMTPWKKRANIVSGLFNLGGAATTGGYAGAASLASKGKKKAAGAAVIGTILGDAISQIGAQTAQLISDRKDLEAGAAREYGGVSISQSETFGMDVPGLEGTIRESTRRAQAGKVNWVDIVQEVMGEDETEDYIDQFGGGWGISPGSED